LPVAAWHLIGMNGEDRYMLAVEVASEARVSVSSVRHWIRTGKLPSVRPGRRRLVRRADFDQFMARKTPASPQGGHEQNAKEAKLA